MTLHAFLDAFLLPMNVKNYWVIVAFLSVKPVWLFTSDVSWGVFTCSNSHHFTQGFVFIPFCVDHSVSVLLWVKKTGPTPPCLQVCHLEQDHEYVTMILSMGVYNHLHHLLLFDCFWTKQITFIWSCIEFAFKQMKSASIFTTSQ